ncbi:kinase-like domain-containing protein [Xylaria sp. FL0933]|nr:kinase-like domain-containing protein [Xylaria sp. FL0933]
MPAFATLAPKNALAKLAFSDLCGYFTHRRRNAPGNGTTPFDRMVIDEAQKLDEQVRQIQIQKLRGGPRDLYASSTESSEDPEEIDSDMELERENCGMIWTGHYILSFDLKPSNPQRGYTLGKGPQGVSTFDILICTPSFAKTYGINLRNPHAKFNFFSETGILNISGGSNSQSRLIVGGKAIGRQPHALNQHSITMFFDGLEYEFRWTDYAKMENFLNERKQYMSEHLGTPRDVDYETPTPRPNSLSLGKWTLGDSIDIEDDIENQSKICYATSTFGEVAAIKLVRRTVFNYRRVNADIEKLNVMKDFANTNDYDCKLERVSDVVYLRDESFSPENGPDQVAICLTPFPRQTGRKGLTIEMANTFRDSLLALQVLHDNNRVHRNLNPENIGLINSNRAFLRGLEQSEHLQHGKWLYPAPGSIGTPGYLAPELELDRYDHSVDIWAMGVILYYLTYNRHPWEYVLNPWCEGGRHERLREPFEQKYHNAIKRMTKDYVDASEQPKDGYIHRECSLYQGDKY